MVMFSEALDKSLDHTDIGFSLSAWFFHELEENVQKFTIQKKGNILNEESHLWKPTMCPSL